MPGPVVEAVSVFGELLEELLQTAETAKHTNRIESPLNKSDLRDTYGRIDAVFDSEISAELRKKSQYAVIETAARDAFNSLLASTTIESAEFTKLWNLLDIISILSDDEQCDPALLFWLVEELLDSQTIAGCRKIFDYLESRRERITAKHFGQKNLVILRSCNELLRRLSRAEDTAFCGRVFMFMFQSFPLGEKSSVNLRGEYHTENITTFDVLPPKESTQELEDGKMDVDTEATPKSMPVVNEPSDTNKVTPSNKETPLSPDELYPIFWSLQQYLNQPKKLFDPANFTSFRSGLEATMTMFRSFQSDNNRRPDDSKRGIKRKRGQSDDDLASAFNPKYLTSRDLFELEISDLAFRRNVLVQVLIILDFLLSLSVKAKEKLAKATLPDNPNKSVMYADQLLSEEDAKWAIEMKGRIATYLKQGLEGPFFYRMVETVLTRDKNWVRWKIENCPSIAKPALAPDEYLQAKAAAKKATMNKRLRPNPLGSLDLKFLAEGDGQLGLERLKDPSRYQIPAVKSFQSKIELDDMDIDMARDDESKNSAIESKASKSWRALRIASRSKLVAFDKIERSDKIDTIFQENAKVEDPVSNSEEENIESQEQFMPTDRRPIAIAGPSGVGKGTLIKMLLDKHPKVFGKKASHTTRAPRVGEVHGQHYFFVTKEAYDVMRDGDEFLEYNCFNENHYGTSRKVVEGIIASGKVPVMEMEYHGIQQVKDNDYPARYIFLTPPDVPELEQRLKRRGSDSDESIEGRLKTAHDEIEQAKTSEGFYDTIIVNDDLQSSFEKLERYIFDGDNAEDWASIAQADGADEAEEEGSKADEIKTEAEQVMEGVEGIVKTDEGAPAEEVTPAEDPVTQADAENPLE
ncbi:guanylate kinase [Phlyctema vagabunda]|uniref:guanylate kinase n=1 Tax=Phlyctema vagabunda TaxID=108571 RepID=A0ABR4PQP2_9HELO